MVDLSQANFLQLLQVERTSDMVLSHHLASALEAGLEASAPATAAYFALAWKMKFQVALLVFVVMEVWSSS